MRALAKLSLVVSVVLGVPLYAHAASWTICNRTAEDVNVAIGYLHTSGQWLSEGWWTIRSCGGCAQVMNLAKTDQVRQYFRAETTGGSERVGGSTRFCVSNRSSGQPPFTVGRASQCRGNYVSVGFRAQDVEWADRNFKTNINPQPGSGGRVCID
jgi:uncharacterized membrane protein